MSSILLNQVTITGVAVSPTFALNGNINGNNNNPIWLIIRSVSGTSATLQINNPEDNSVWDNITDNNGVVKQFTINGTYEISSMIRNANFRINQTAGTSASYQVIQ